MIKKLPGCYDYSTMSGNSEYCKVINSNLVRYFLAGHTLTVTQTGNYEHIFFKPVIGWQHRLWQTKFVMQIHVP